MNGAGQVGFYGWVMNSIITKGYVPNDGIKIVVRERGFFKSLSKDDGVGVQFFGNPGCEGVQFNADPVSSLQLFRHKTEEMAYSHGGFQHFHAFSCAEALHSIPNCLNNQR